MIQSLKEATLRLLQRAGVSSLVAASDWRRRRLLILAYHGVSLDDEHRWLPSLYISPRDLEARLQLLKKHRCSVLPLGEAVTRLYAGTLPDRAVVLTFDDGYYDFLAKAWPLLKQYGYPATVYLTTGRVLHNLPIVNLCISYALWASSLSSFDGRAIPGLGDGTYPLGDAESRQRLATRIAEALPGVDVADRRRDGAARMIAERAGVDYDSLVQRRVLTLLRPDEVSRLAAEGVDFQLHTHLHRTPEDPDEFMRDLLVNRSRLEEMTGRTASHLCYPSGNYRASYLPVLRQHGIASATTCDPDLADVTSEPLLLPRFVDTGGVSNIVFESWLTGMAACLPRRTTRGGYRVATRPVDPAALSPNAT
jgi:peptidoglycan/xylan/chitin deacetylase (PgdA/CDA1 family)